MALPKEGQQLAMLVQAACAAHLLAPGLRCIHHCLPVRILNEDQMPSQHLLPGTAQ